MTRYPLSRLSAALLAIIGWTALLIQCYWAVEASIAKGASLLGATVDVLSYFTILTNILVAAILTQRAFSSPEEESTFLLRPTTMTAAASYIVIVSLIYELALRRLWSPTGLHLLIDATLHYVLPIAYFVYWLTAVRKGTLRYSSVGWWTLYPFIYLLYTAVRGALDGFFPYPFVDFHSLGLRAFSWNVAGMVALFVGAGLLFVALDHWVARRMQR